jgi:hypothetical protein
MELVMKKLKPDIIKILKMTTTVTDLRCEICPLNDRVHGRTCITVLRDAVGDEIIEKYLPMHRLYSCGDVRNACYQMWKDLESKRIVKI